MNKNFVFYIAILTLFSCTKSFSPNIKQELVADWEFKQDSTEDWYSATVPGCVHSDLLNHKLIDDYFLDTNEQNVQWVEEKNWVYKSNFSVDEKILNRKYISLVFSGLDAYSEVFLNDSLILTTDNMFVEYEISCKKILQKENKLLIKFQSPIKKEAQKSKKYPYDLDGGTKVHTRKAGYHYGWDWGPRIVTSGIWRPIFINAYDFAKIENIQLVNLDISDQKAKIKATFEINSLDNFDGKIKITNNGNSLKTSELHLKKGLNTADVFFEIENPKLWWTNGLGEQFLYDLNFELLINNVSVENKTIKHGVRTVELVTDTDSLGENFYFKLNGVPVFMKGANYIPQDNLLTRVSSEDYKKILLQAKEMNINMLRVWGGGVYENDIFYDLCDANGILVWQDFMFACAMYPNNKEFLESVKIEASQNIKRLRNHACLALWCGNNEIDEAWHNWGWSAKYNSEDSAKVRRGYEQIFMSILPNLVSKFDSLRAYRHSSPTFGRGNPNYVSIGDAHDWYVWHDAKPFEHFEQNVPRFMSEFGFQSVPAMHSLRKFVSEPNIGPECAAMKNHQKHPRGNQLIKKYMKDNFFVPDDFEYFIYLSQLMQADGISKAIEAHRRAWKSDEENPHCGGSLFWQLNDCWPAVSWSAIDYYNDKKALFYFSKKVFETLLISYEIENGELDLFVISDSLSNFDAELSIQTKDFWGNVVFTDKKNVNVKSNSSKIYSTIALKKLLNKKLPNEVFFEVVLSQNGQILSEKIIYPTKSSKLKLPNSKPTFEVSKMSDNEYIIKIKSDVLMKNIYLEAGADAEFSDNFFDVLPNVEYKIICKSEKEITNSIKLHKLKNKL